MKRVSSQKIKKLSIPQEVVIYQAKNGAIEFRGDCNNETVWATQAQIALVFELERSVVTKHIKNIFSDKELDENSVCAKFAHTAGDGKMYNVQFYNLDIILSVGYRANSSKAIEFRKWATKTLRSHIVDGFSINKKRISHNYEVFRKAVDDVRALVPASYSDTDSVLELISLFAHTWMSLDAYDKETLSLQKPTKKKVIFTSKSLSKDIATLKQELIKKGEATEHFATERNRDALEGIVGNVLQSFGGNHVYESVEEKAAHLLYFIVKNHPFVDGNKRTGAYAFVWFLSKAKTLDITTLTPSALTAITLLVAESDPKNKQRVVALVMMLLGR